MLYHMHRDNINLHRYFDAFVTESRHASPKLRNARPISPLRGALLRVGLGASLVECPGMLLVGDAASMINPVSGEGITFALETGEMAAEHIIENMIGPRGIHHDPVENSFRKKLLDRYLHYFTLGTRSIRWGNRPTFMRPLLGVLSRNQSRREDAIRALMYLRH
jgi:flavin-dependent dehydrogenase